MKLSTVIYAAVEGPTDEAVVKKLIENVGATVGAVFGKKGKAHLRAHINGYNRAAQYRPWFVLVDLDDVQCAPALREDWSLAPEKMMCFCVAVRKVEAWLMADAEALASFLGIRQSQVPERPEVLGDPKEAMVNLARKSRRRAIYQDMVPREGSGRSTGPAYESRMIEFTIDHWRPDIAANHAGSLKRALSCLERLVGRRR